MKTSALLTAWFCAAAAFAAPTTIVDFTNAGHGWSVTNHAKDIASRPDGLAFTVTGIDPWINSPAVTLPAPPSDAKRIVFTLTCAPTECGDSWQLFYVFGHGNFNETDSCRLRPAGKPPYTRFEGEIIAGSFRNPCRFRLDPPGNAGTAFTAKSLSFESKTPLWTYHPAKAAPLVIPALPLVLKGKDWELRHDPDRIGAFRFLSRGKTVENLPQEPFIYLDRNGKVQTLDWSKVPMEAHVLSGPGNGVFRLETHATSKDIDGRIWTLERTFIKSADRKSYPLFVVTKIKVDPASQSDCAQVLHLPALTLFVDRHSNGHKHQAMLPGIEYLADEPSSNDKEIRTFEHNRLIPAPHCFCWSGAIFTDSEHWLLTRWIPNPTMFATVFDTPDRQFQSGGHLLGFWAPAVGPHRRPNDFCIYTAHPFQKAEFAIALETGDGSSVAEVLEQKMTDARKLPEPDSIDQRAALAQLAHGWLDSQIRQGSKVKHAIGGSFQFQQAADAPYLMKYLASVLEHDRKDEEKLAPRLRSVAAEMLKEIPASQIGHSGVSHIRRPAPVLVGGDVKAWLASKANEQRGINRQLAGGKRIWRAPANRKDDLGSTLGSDHCNGFTSMQLASLLKAAVWSGDEAEIAKTLAIVDKVTELYHGTVPRGAQPWEMPLHCPDIMASANLTEAYTLAYRLKPDPKYLKEARHWAYSGLSMVYLDHQWKNQVGNYATCAVMGATHWVAPNWIGRPVQWCGLVYSAALWDLARVEPEPNRKFWNRIATGITHSGVNQNHTAKEDPQFVGLLPDSWNLEQQNRFPIPINPGAVQENLAEAIDMPFYSVGSLGGTSLLHVPGRINEMKPRGATRLCQVTCWPDEPFRAVATRIDKPTEVFFSGKPVAYEYDSTHRALIVTLPARAKGVLSCSLAAKP